MTSRHCLPANARPRMAVPVFAPRLLVAFGEQRKIKGSESLKARCSRPPGHLSSLLLFERQALPVAPMRQVHDLTLESLLDLSPETVVADDFPLLGAPADCVEYDAVKVVFE